MPSTKTPTKTHQIQGQFLGFIPKPKNELKYMQLQVGERILAIKLAKEIRKPVANAVKVGEQLLVSLEPKTSDPKCQLKLKADRIQKLDSGVSFPTPKKGKILICRKSSCSKKGGKTLYSALVETLKNLGLQEQVSIEFTGCQKQCKQAPSIILMPSKAKYNNVDPNDLPSLLEAHYL
ncbi:MAG: (2Fe-2S) ferredoxin domain-containing protein [Halothece sp.]